MSKRCRSNLRLIFPRYRDHRGGRGGGPVGFHRAQPGTGRGGQRGGGAGDLVFLARHSLKESNLASSLENLHVSVLGGGGGGGSGSANSNSGGQQQRGGSRGGRGAFVPGRPTQTKKEPLKFDSEYDFDAANEEFAEVSKIGLRNLT